MNNVSLQLAPPVALVACQRPSRYVGSTSVCSGVVITSLAVCVGVGYVGLLAAILAATTLVVLCFAAMRSRWVQGGLDRNSLRRARARRESERRDALYRATAARREQYIALNGLVEGIETSDPVEAGRLELQELLDHYVQLAVGHQRCMESLRVIGGSDLQATTPICETSEKGHTPRRREIMARRIRHREETTTRLAAIADEIDAADDLIRLVAQRTACANLDTLIDGEGEIGRRLADLDDVEAALVQVSA